MSRARHARRILEPIAAAAKRGGGGAFAAPRVAGFVATRSAAGSSSSSPSRIGGFFRCDLVPSSARFRTDHRAPHLARGIAASPHLAADNAADAKKKADDEDAKTPAADPTDPTDPDPDATTHAFQAETRRLLDIVTNSLYTDKEVFVRELVSNASATRSRSAATRTSRRAKTRASSSIAIDVDDEKRTFSISDTGLGMSADLSSARTSGRSRASGSRAFVDSMKDGVRGCGNKDASASASSTAATNIIGKFGVGFYCVVHGVATVVDVYSSVGDGVGHKWSQRGGRRRFRRCRSARSGEGRREAPEARARRSSCTSRRSDKTFAASAWAVESTLKKHSAFVGFPVTPER